MTTPDDAPALRVVNLTKRFGGLAAVDNLNLTVRRGATHCIIGPNGAGKSTFFDLVTNVQPATSGDIYVFGERITGLPPYRCAGLGIARKFQAPTLFPELTAAENLFLGKVGHLGWNRLLRTRATTGRRCGGDRIARAPAVGGTGADPGGRSVSRPAAVVRDRGGPDGAAAPIAARRADGRDVAAGDGSHRRAAARADRRHDDGDRRTRSGLRAPHRRHHHRHAPRAGGSRGEPGRDRQKRLVRDVYLGRKTL